MCQSVLEKIPNENPCVVLELRLAEGRKETQVWLRSGTNFGKETPVWHQLNAKMHSVCYVNTFGEYFCTSAPSYGRTAMGPIQIGGRETPPHWINICLQILRQFIPFGFYLLFEVIKHSLTQFLINILWTYSFQLHVSTETCNWNKLFYHLI